jgi:uncharacterized protein YndB with AHSA1/START domain
MEVNKMREIVILVAALSLVAGAALAETSAVSPSGFLVTHRHEVKATPQQVYEAIARIGQWWSEVHTYSGHAANLTLNLDAGGCFCEKWDGNAVQHAQVISARRGALVRLQGGLGPLQPLPVSAILTFAMAASGDKTQLTVTYSVAGNADAALDKLAGPVDSVIGEATDRLVAYVESGKP